MENNENIEVLKTPRRTRRTSILVESRKPIAEEVQTDNKIATLKTPNRKRRASIKDLELTAENTVPIGPPKTPRGRSRQTSVIETQSTIPEVIEDGNDEPDDLGKVEPVTPGRSTRTPGRYVDVQTPRRSCRKSIKPIQEYENIVAQKGLTIKAKRNLVESTSEELEKENEEASLQPIEMSEREGKWNAAEIGRVSSKRSKKKRNKNNKTLQRQTKVCDDDHHSEENEQENRTQNQEEHQITESQVENDHMIRETNKIGVEVKELAIDENEKEVETEADKIVETVKEDIKSIAEEQSNNTDDEKGVSTEILNSMNQNEKDVPLTRPQSEQNQIENQIQIVCEKQEEECEDEEGDLILNAMPITGDDCMLSPGKPKISLSPTSFLESEKSADNSDCVLLLSDESVQSRQKFDANESIDSTGNIMPPLIVCSDDDNDDDDNDDKEHVENIDKVIPTLGEQSQSSINKNETFNTDENTKDDRLTEKRESETLDTVMSSEEEDEEKIVKTVFSAEEIKKIVFGVDEQSNDNKTKLIIANSKENDEQVTPLDETFDADDSPIQKIINHEVTPKASVNTCHYTISRLPTPFKTKTTSIPDVFIEPEDEAEDAFNIIIEPTNYNLKSSRKRSFSFCDADRPKKNVTFHSPSNTTMNIYDEDLSKSSTKQTSTNITKRRKRSLSVTETERDLMDYIKGKKPTTPGTTPQKKVIHQSKIRMPNFSNIHQKQFLRMESITDHIARRAERAKNLINSHTKVKPASVQKGLPPKNSALQTKDVNKPHIPKARLRIDMSGQENKTLNKNINNSNLPTFKFQSKSKQDIKFLDGTAPLNSKTPTKVGAKSTSLFKLNNANKLPKPKFNFNFDSTNVPPCGNTTVGSIPQRIHLPNPREHFNSGANTTTFATNTNTNTGQATKIGAKKMENLEDRRKRMMDMFKSKNKQKLGENKKEILKGVRTNRRFELQMMHRNHQN